MMHPSTKKLVDRLCAMTAQGKIAWTQGEEPGSLVYDTEGYRVVLHGEPTNILLTDMSGKELEKVEAANLSATAHEEKGTYDVLVAGLVADAGRVARGTETAIDSVMKGLDLDGDGVVDIPMEDGLVPTPAEIEDPAPDVVEDAADETGVAGLADADVADMSNAVASLADQVNQTEIQQAAPEPTPEISEPDPEPNTPAPGLDGGAITGLSAAGLGAAGLLKAARKTTEPAEPETSTELSGDVHETASSNGSSEPVPNPFQVSPAPPAPAPPPEDTPAEIEAEAQPQEPAAEPELTITPPETSQQSSTLQPGQVLSLSGLTKGTHEDIPVMAGTAITMPHTDQRGQFVQQAGTQTPETPAPTEASAPEPTEPEIVETPVDTPPAAPAQPETPAPAETSAAPDVETPPEVPAEPDAEPEEPAAPPANSRFNPWI